MRKLLIAIMALVLAFGLAACGGSEEVPADVQAVKDQASSYVEQYAADLTEDGWGDEYAALIASGEARDYAEYNDIMQDLWDARVECGATYIYAMTPLVDDVITYDVEAGYAGDFAITVDGCEDPDDWGVNYGWEVQFTEAWDGATAAARSAWINDEVGDNHDICWSAFAPVYDSEGNVVCILGIDYPCADVLNDYPEWNRDMEEWNGIEE